MHIREYSLLALQMGGHKKFYGYVRAYFPLKGPKPGVKRGCNGFNKRKRIAKKKKAFVCLNNCVSEYN